MSLLLPLYSLTYGMVPRRKRNFQSIPWHIWVTFMYVLTLTSRMLLLVDRLGYSV